MGPGATVLTDATWLQAPPHSPHCGLTVEKNSIHGQDESNRSHINAAALMCGSKRPTV